MTAVRRCLPTLPSALRRAVRTLAVALAATAALTALAAAPAQAADTAPAWNLDRLMSTLAQHKSGRATFTETKYLSIATQPVESSGELVFVAPDHLEKHTLSPKPEHLVVDGDMLTVERNNRKFTLAFARYPELGAFIDSIRATLAGRGDDWTLTLTPLDSRMLKVVSTITLDGTRDMLRSVAIRQADGDRSVMRLQPVPANPN